MRGKPHGRGRSTDVTTILVAGTASHVGKSTVAAGLCRLLADRGYRVAPFKAQNMSNNARVAPIPTEARRIGDPTDETAGVEATEQRGSKATTAAEPHDEWGEIGVSQYVQARATRRPATTDSNPVLLKPRGDGESQLLVNGRPVGHYEAGTFYDDHWETARAAAEAAHDRLAATADVVVAEGAGGLGEINLHDRDLANVATARFSDARILLVVDTERGGAFASLYGTLQLMPDDVRQQVVAAAFTKFRGDRSLLRPGIEEIEEKTGVPVIGVLPYDDPGLPAEDSVSLPPVGTREVWGSDDGVADDEAVTVGVVRLPRVSNATDVEPLARTPGVRVAFQPPGAKIAADALVIPGTKNTVDDLRALREAGFPDRLAGFDGPIVGLCGGYQLLGERLTAAHVESTGDERTIEGLGVLPVQTTFRRRKRIERVERSLAGVGPLAGADGSVEGYEIHMGQTHVPDGLPSPVGPHSVATDRVLGTYLHGLFENAVAREAFLDRVFAAADTPRPTSHTAERSPYEAAARLVDRLELTRLLPGGEP